MSRRPPTSSSAARVSLRIPQETRDDDRERRPLRPEALEERLTLGQARAQQISVACRFAISTWPRGSSPTTPVATVASTAAVRRRAASSACRLVRMSAAMRSNAPNTGSNSRGGWEPREGIGSALAPAQGPSGGARPRAVRAPARRGRRRPAQPRRPASVARSSTSARSSCRTARDGSSASCGVASTPRSDGEAGLDHAVADPFGRLADRTLPGELELPFEGERDEGSGIHELPA